ALTPVALAMLQATVPDEKGRLIPTSASAVKQAWRRLLKRAGIAGLHFHDLRHEAIRRLFERGLTMPEAALISGHRDPLMLFPYTHHKAEQVAKKLHTPVSRDPKPPAPNPKERSGEARKRIGR